MGLFVAIEGGDGSGKGTHSELLRKYISDQLRKTVYKISFPRYGNDSAYYVEKYLNGAYGSASDVPADLGVLPYAIDRYAASRDIRLHLKDGETVVADRYMASNLAHQGSKIVDKDERYAFYERTKKTEYEVLGIPKPDKNIVLIMPTKQAQLNVDKKESRKYTTLKRDIHESDESHLELAKTCFEELCVLYPDEFTAILCTDASGAMLDIQTIQAEIRSLLTH